MSTAKVKLPEFRISLAAVGRRLSSVIVRAGEGELSKDDFFDTINAVFAGCISADFTPGEEANINTEILAAEQAEIEKSARRSAAARKAAERRRRMREAREKAAEIKPDPASPAPQATISPVAVKADEEDEIMIRDPKYDSYGVRRRCW